mmetsp:Transcript_13893/g.22683  ORF Transcript_13893/g.22683 Transcript_13893/m.22683 type:complete len:280 (-) Transcript_13893:65-904(-)
MSHASSRRSSKSRNKTNYRFVWVSISLQPLSSLFLSLSSNLSNHNNTFRFWIICKSFKTVNKVGSIERITSNSNTCGLSKTSRGCLCNCFVGQGTRSGNNSNLTRGMDISRHNTDLAFIWLNDTRTVRSYQPGLILLIQVPLYLYHILLRDSFGNTHNQWNLGFNRFENRLACNWRRHKDYRGVNANIILGLLYGIKHREAQMSLAALAWGSSPDHIGTIGDGLLRVEGPLLAGEPLAKHLGVLVHPHIGRRRHCARRLRANALAQTERGARQHFYQQQ